MKKITVLLSSYNGHKYIEQLINSVLAQKGVDVRLFIRDDGSTDDTLDILSRYRENNSNVEFYQGSNIGPAYSFLELIGKAPESDYYALCDEDDIWLKDKLLRAVEKLEDFDEQPAMYYSDLQVVDADLNYIGMMHGPGSKQESRYTSLVDNDVTGCTVVFNHPLMLLLRRGSPETCLMHDMWINTVVSFFGTRIYDDNAYILYRQHGGNVIGAGAGKTSAAERIKQKLSRLQGGNQPRYTNALEFWKIYGDLLDPADRREVRKLLDYRKNPAARVRLMADRKIRAGSRKEDLKYRALIALGLI